MKRVGEIMEELGFKKDASPSVKEAFVRHLIKQAYGAQIEPIKKTSDRVDKKSDPDPPQQLRFDLAIGE